jgi:hypothetical protein
MHIKVDAIEQFTLKPDNDADVAILERLTGKYLICMCLEGPEGSSQRTLTVDESIPQAVG